MLAQLYFEGSERGPFLSRFVTMLGLSVLLAALGLARNSGPVVIGAMLVSPLTTPLMGLCASLVMGWPRRQLESILIVAAASLLGVGLGWLAMVLIPEPETLTIQSQQLLARTDPRLLDLAIALVAGAAGAYVLVRREAIGALPGVAIAVSLVPPLTAVGMMLELGEARLAADALLLYVTNLAGIVLAGSVVLLLAGVRPQLPARGTSRQAKLGIGIAVLAAVAVAYPLQVATRHGVNEAVDQDDATRAAEDWVAGTELEVSNVKVTEDSVHLDVRGPERPPPIKPLARELAREFEQEVELTVGWTKQEILRARESP